MAAHNEIETMARLIMEQNKGQAYFNFSEAYKIVGCGINTFSQMVAQAGILVTRAGPSKRISALDVARLMHIGRVASYDNSPSRCSKRA